MDAAPWGIGAWQFLGLYWIGFAVALAVAVVAVVRARRAAGTRVVDGTPLGHYQLAWLAGGAARVEEVALAVLLSLDLVRVDQGGVVHRRVPTVPVGDPVAEWLLTAIGHARGLTGPGSLGFEGTPLCRDMVTDLARRGHLVPGGNRSPGYGWHWLVGAVVGVGVLRLFAELEWEWQVGILLITLVVSGALWSGLAFVLRSARTRPSAAGKAALGAVGAQVARIHDLRAEPAWLPAAVAVEGITSHPGGQGELIAAWTRPRR